MTPSTRAGATITAARRELERIEKGTPELGLPRVLDLIDALEELVVEARMARADIIGTLRTEHDGRAPLGWAEIALLTGRGVKYQAVQGWADYRTQDGPR